MSKPGNEVQKRFLLKRFPLKPNVAVLVGKRAHA
jgi:hypothetical protein